MDSKSLFVMFNLMIKMTPVEELIDENIKALEMLKMFPESKEHLEQAKHSSMKLTLKLTTHEDEEMSTLDGIMKVSDKLDMFSNIEKQMKNPNSN